MLLVAVVVVVVAFVGLGLFALSNDLGTAVDFPFTVYQGEEVLGGSELRFSEVLSQGKPVVLNFWGGDCPPCRIEMPDLQRVYERHQGEVIFLGLDVGPFTRLGTRESALALLAELRITYPAGAPPSSKAPLDYRILDLPTTVFVDAGGTIVRRWAGNITEDELEAIVSDLLR